MKKLTLFFLIIFLAACQNQTENAGNENRPFTIDTNSGTSSEIKEEKVSSDASASVELPLYLAQCSEPFMAAYFFENKIRLIFPEKTDSILNIENSIDWNTDFEGKFNSVNHLNVHLSVKNKPCVHPGSGENWEKMVTFVISNREYKGCIKKLN
jgi:uncharacterized membrane protein